MKELNAAWTTIKRKEWETRISQETKRGLKAAITKEYTDNFGLNFPQIMLDEKRQAKKKGMGAVSRVCLTCLM